MGNLVGIPAAAFCGSHDKPYAEQNAHQANDRCRPKAGTLDRERLTLPRAGEKVGEITPEKADYHHWYSSKGQIAHGPRDVVPAQTGDGSDMMESPANVAADPLGKERYREHQ